MELLILPFDHRSSFSKKILGIEVQPTPEQIGRIKGLKKLIFEAFLNARSEIENPQNLGILVDECYGKEILKEANEKGITTSVGVEKSGQEVFTFEYGKDFGEHILEIDPTYVKVLVRYNPENKRINRKQLRRLKKLSKFCEKNNRKLLFELLVPPTEKKLETSKDFDTEIRPTITARALKEIAKKIKVDIWKLEGSDTAGWNIVLEALPKDAKVIVLGRGEDKEKVKFWLTEASKFDQIIGFAIGRTIFMQPLVDLLENGISEEEARTQIAQNYRYFVDFWRQSKKQNNLEDQINL